MFDDLVAALSGGNREKSLSEVNRLLAQGVDQYRSAHFVLQGSDGEPCWHRQRVSHSGEPVKTQFPVLP